MTQPAAAAGRLDAGLISLAAAHGITPRVAATWSPALLRTPRVLVPVELDVLMVRDDTLTWAATGMTTPPRRDDAGDGPLTPAAGLLPEPFTDLAAPRPRGAYLHWYLPNGLTSGTSDAGSDTAVFPPIPDRWLVLRISQGALGRRAVRGWVLEAGGEPPQVTDLDSWTEPGTAPDVEKPLTALGHGDVSWAGYFDNVVNRLGFYDGSLDPDQVTGPLAYLVCGWYADPTADPLGDQAITSLAGFHAAMAGLGWTLADGDLDEVTRKVRDYTAAASAVGLASVLDARIAATTATQVTTATGGYVTNGSWWPAGSLLHGAVVGIDWPGSGDVQEAGGPPDPATVRVAVGNTMAETIGALVALANDAPGEAVLVEALQLGVVQELDQPDGLAALDVALHASSFAGQPGGGAATEPVAIAPSGPPPAPPQSPPSPAPGIFAAPAPDGQAGTGGAPVTVGAVGGAIAGAAVAVFGQVVSGEHVAELTTSARTAAGVLAEETIISGSLSAVITHLGAGVTVPPADPGGTVDARRAAPRFFLPRDPVVLVQGGKRAFVHDSTVATKDGLVVCRLTPVSELSWQLAGTLERSAVRGADVLERGVENGSVPLECEGILQETALLDTGSAPAIAVAAAASASTGTASTAAASTGAASTGAASTGAASAAVLRNITVEQTAWYSLRNPDIDHGPLLAHSGIAGLLPAPFAVAPAARPWTPLHLEWSAEFVPSPGGIADWELDQVDYVLGDQAVVPEAGTGVLVTGRSPLTGGASATLASAIVNALGQASRIGGTDGVPVPADASGRPQREAFYSPQAQALLARFQGFQLATSPGQSGTGGAPGQAPGELSDIATALAQMDVLSCGLGGLLTQLRPDEPAAGTFFAVRAGFLRFVRLRLVDGFGQFTDLCGSDATHQAQGYVVSGPLTVDGQPGVIGLPPRFSAPARAWFRFMSGQTPGQEADYQTSPVCAFVLPNHLDGSLEFFRADGSAAGSLQPQSSGQVAWQDAPGRATVAGQDPGAALANTAALQLARSLIDWGIADAGVDREPALSSLLRTIDSARWAVDPFGHAGDEHLSLLLGHPVCVLRAQVRLDVDDPVVTADGTVTAVPVRLGDLTQWQDGLLGYFADDDYTVLHVADAAAPGMARQVGPQQGFLQQINLVPGFYDTFADDLNGGTGAGGGGTGGDGGNGGNGGSDAGATPVTHPYVDTSGVLWIRPGQTVALTLLVEPLTSIHATLGLVPRKEIGLRRSWVQAGLAAIAPTFSFGPVLVDPQHIRMPLATDLNGTWVWDYRSDATTWIQSQTTNATDDAQLPADPPTAVEGWLKLTPPASESDSSGTTSSGNAGLAPGPETGA